MSSHDEPHELRQLRQENESFRLMIDGVKDYAIFMLDPDGYVTTWNTGAQRIKGFSATEIIGQHFSRFFPPEQVAAGKPQRELQIAREKGKYEEEGIRVRKDGSTFWANVLITALFDNTGQLRGFSKITRDITERRNVQEELIRAKEQAEQASRAKDHFLSVLSHELRTPLTPILATVSIMEKRTDVPEPIRIEIGALRRNIELEARLVDDLLDMTRIARGKIALHAEVIDVHLLIRSALQNVQADLDQKGLDLLTSLRAKRRDIWADPTRLEQVLINLFQNAVKFTPEGGHITVRTSNHGDNIRVEVIDTGIGIEPNVLPNIFNPFEQGENTITRRFGGLGLGLAICKSMVDLHHGTLTAASDGRGKGATFTLELEALAEELPPEPAVTDAAPVRKNIGQLLYVEDHDETRRVMTKLLEGAGFTVRTAASVSEAMQLAEKEQFDLLVSDIGLPDGTGHDIMRYLKTRGVRGIALSGFGQQEDLNRSAEAGFETHLVKPVNAQTLEGTVRRVAQRATR